MRRETRWAHGSTWLLAIISAGALLSSCGGAAPRQVSTSSDRASFTYSCCTSAVGTGTTARPGQTFKVGWTRVRTPSSSRATIRMRLQATLEGPFMSVKQLKERSSTRVATSIAAAPVEVSNWSDVVPVSSVRIPAGVRSGYYNLVWRVASGSSWSISGASVIHVE
jgi:hypothetical protein